MNEPHAGPGWYADPAGLDEWHYSDGRWADQVVTGGVGSTQVPPPDGVADLPTELTARMRARKLWVLAAAGAGAATVGVVLAVHPGHRGSSFCSDYAAIGGISASATLADGDLATARALVTRVQKLAAEAPPAAKADMALLADDVTSLMSTGSPSLSDQDAQAASDRVDAIAQAQCHE